MCDIFVQPEDVWDFIQEHQYDTSDALIAENADFGIEIYASYSESANGFSVYVFLADEGEDIYSEELYNKDDTKSVVSRIYNEYLDESVAYKIVDYLQEDDPFGMAEARADAAREVEESLLNDSCSQMILARESEIDNALLDLIAVVCEDGMSQPEGDISDMCEDIKELVLDRIYKKYKVDIYRPMILEDESGEEFFEEYPYSCFVE